jgi:hypothetical protein
MKKILFFIFTCIFPVLLLADKTYQPWYTGPLISISSNNQDKGTYNIQPYLYFRDSYGIYTNEWKHHSVAKTHAVETEVFFQRGLTNWLDFTFITRASYKEKQHKHSFQYGETSGELGFQLLKEEDLTPKPSIRIIFRETFPTGKYKNLNPNKNNTDSSGNGAYASLFGLIIGKVVYWITDHPISWRFNFLYIKSSKVSVSGFNSWGGGYGTKGKITPGDILGGFFAFEFSFTQRWAYAMDIIYLYENKEKFKGNPGVDSNGNPVATAGSNKVQLSLAPALEYNFSSTLGVIGGLFFSVTGKNSQEFITGVISLEYTF